MMNTHSMWKDIINQYKDSGIEVPLSIIKLLASREVKPGGPYYSISSKSISKEDNLGICVMLLNHDISLNPLIKYLNENLIELAGSRYLAEFRSHIEASESDGVDISIWRQLNLPPSRFLDELRVNSFTLEIAAQPLQLNQGLKLNLPPSILSQLVKTNLYGWIYFAILDNKLDRDARVDRSLESLMSIAKEKALATLGTNPYISWVSSAEQVMRTEDKGVSEKDSIIRAKPLYIGLAPYLSKRQMASLNSYYLAKQYVDDLYDFEIDLKEDRKTLVTSLLNKGDPYEEFTIRICPKVHSRVLQLLSSAEGILGHFPPLISMQEAILSNKEFNNLRNEQFGG